MGVTIILQQIYHQQESCSGMERELALRLLNQPNPYRKEHMHGILACYVGTKIRLVARTGCLEENQRVAEERAHLQLQLQEARRMAMIQDMEASWTSSWTIWKLNRRCNVGLRQTSWFISKGLGLMVK
jgi:hypothetical protein